MAVTSQERESKMDRILKELSSIRSQLRKFIVLIPEESLKGYKDANQIKKAYLRAIRKYPPK